ncbi:hypothetical protein EV673_0519 [Limnobacter thiooxidans]|uniref:AsmA family protein n=1 Tax=Limnobacter thiooxidans TaxID=131080 RepID=A0AA86J172_9BURK|nr:hypothetical protein EV673_0519 [Limnobacter thiooxidans]BET26378.1 AsmA family protein [Limnobacter thiooxidans]
MNYTITTEKRRKKPVLKAFGFFAVLLVLAIGLCEWMGWPFLAKPAQQWLGQALKREVHLTNPNQDEADFQLRLIGGIRLELGYVQLGAPSWSEAPYMVQGKNLTLVLNYRDLLGWGMNPENTLRIETLKADFLDAHFERLEDGRASWQIDPDKPRTETSPPPNFGLLAIKAGTIRYNDAPLDLKLNAQLALQESNAQTSALKVSAQGEYQNKKLNVELTSSGVLPWVADDAEPIPVTLDASLQGVKLSFKGHAADALKMQKLSGHFVVSGTSLATVGDALGLTLPNTPSFRTEGDLKRDEKTWKASIASATIGSSHLTGEFVYNGADHPPMLSGTLKGTSLVLADLGPTVGASTTKADDVKNTSGKVLPNQPFDLPALRAMNADVNIDIDNLDLGSEILKPLRPLRAHLLLTDGILRIADIEAKTAQGELVGMVQLDGQKELALWELDLKWKNIKLEQWLNLTRSENQTPYVTGEFKGAAQLKGQGRSTAEILASLKGQIRTEVENGTMSHLVIEAAGLDAAEALGVWFSGDKVLNISCAVADLEATEGVLRPRVFLIDTQDSALWVNGSVSMQTEALDLKVAVTPKDFSPMSLRTPLLISGSMGSPNVSLQKGPLASKVASAALLSLINPFAAILPFVDTGTPDSEQNANKTGCHDLAARAKAQKAKSE